MGAPITHIPDLESEDALGLININFAALTTTIQSIKTTVDGSLSFGTDSNSSATFNGILLVDAHDGVAPLRIVNTPVRGAGGGIPNLCEAKWFDFGDGGDAGRVWLQYGGASQAAPLMVFSDLDDASRIQFQQSGTGTECSPQYFVTIGIRDGASSLEVRGGELIMPNNKDIQFLTSGGTPASVARADSSDNVSLGDIFGTLGGTVGIRSGNVTRIDISNAGLVEIGAAAGTAPALIIETDDDVNVALGDLTVTTGDMVVQNGQVGIGTTPATSAKLEIASTAGALLIPRMTTTEKNNLTPVNGMMLYDTTLGEFAVYRQGSWKILQVA